MAKISISIPDEELQIIDAYAKAEYLSRSQVFLKAAMNLIDGPSNKEFEAKLPPAPEALYTNPANKHCEHRTCRNTAVGRFHYKSFDNSSGETVEDTKYLCAVHETMLSEEMGKLEGTFEKV